MTVLRLVLVCAVAALAAGPSFAQRIEVKVQPKIITAQADLPLLTPDAVEKLKLTAEQKDKYGKVEVDFKEKSKSVHDKFQTEIQGDLEREKFKVAFDKMQVDLKNAREDSLAKVEPLLTAEQKTVLAQVKQLPPQPGVIVRPVPIGGVAIGQILSPFVQQRLQLTDEQKKQVETIQKEAEAKIMKLLTDEQSKQLEELKKGGIRPIRPMPPVPPIPPIRIQPVPNPAPALPEPKKD